MIKSHLTHKNGQQGIELTIMGDEEVIFNEFRAIFGKIVNDDKLSQIATDAITSLQQEDIKNFFKENI